MCRYAGLCRRVAAGGRACVHDRWAALHRPERSVPPECSEGWRSVSTHMKRCPWRQHAAAVIPASLAISFGVTG